MSARVRATLLALLALSVVVPALGVGPTVPAATGTASAQTPSNGSALPVGTTRIAIQLDTDGDARWTITTRLDGSGDENRTAFRELVASYEGGASDPPWIAHVRAARDAARQSTGRPMQVTNVETASNATDRTVSVSFTWTNFARETDDGQFVLDDVFNASRGTWMDGLTADQVLVIELPRGYGVLSAPEGAVVQRGRVRWDGPARFEPGYMRVVYSGSAGPNPLFPATWLTGTSGLLVGGFFLVGVAAVGAYVLRRRRGFPVPGSAPGSDGEGPAPPATDRSPAPVENGDEPATAREEPGDAGSTAAAESEGDDGVQEELLSDEERVERLLERNGGRMKQANIVTETQWSNAKVSQLLSAMEEDGRIDKLRIGRENLISFPDEEVTDVDRD